jgi:murein DD-endopeptidase MepM/ murein hydrolase activator NlpD
MTELPQATSRRELRNREAAARVRPAATMRGRVGRAALSFSSMLFVSALAVGLSIPANAFSTASSARADAATSGSATAGSATFGAATAASAAAVPALVAEAQSATVSPDETIAIPVRDGYTSQSRADLLAAQYAVSGIRATGKGSVRWPFTGQAVISSSYGPRAPVCSGSDCTDDFHHGTDFLPGDGAPIFAIASGVVVDHSEVGSDLGNYVTIRHKIGRDVVTSIYGHLQLGSSPLVVGQAVKVGDFVGLVGATGIATGPHLHLGITVNGVETDPLPWMIAHVR